MFLFLDGDKALIIHQFSRHEPVDTAFGGILFSILLAGKAWRTWAWFRSTKPKSGLGKRIRRGSSDCSNQHTTSQVPGLSVDSSSVYRTGDDGAEMCFQSL